MWSITLDNIDLQSNFYYGGQIKRYLNQFAQVFSGMYVQVGKNDFASATNLVKVPIVIGTPDRVVSAIKAENTQNKLVRLPMFAITLDAISIEMDRKSGTNTQLRQTVFPVGGDIKKDMKVLYRSKPLPYNIKVSVSAFTSNSDQMFQLTEQILMLFDPLLQFQSSDAHFDWTKIVDAEMVSIELENNRSQDTDGRILIYTFGFELRVYMAPPANLKANVIKAIRLRVEAIAGDFQLGLDGDRPLPEYTEIYNLDTDENIPPN